MGMHDTRTSRNSLRSFADVILSCSQSKCGHHNRAVTRCTKQIALDPFWENWVRWGNLASWMSWDIEVNVFKLLIYIIVELLRIPAKQIAKIHWIGCVKLAFQCRWPTLRNSNPDMLQENYFNNSSHMYLPEIVEEKESKSASSGPLDQVYPINCILSTCKKSCDSAVSLDCFTQRCDSAKLVEMRQLLVLCAT